MCLSAKSARLFAICLTGVTLAGIGNAAAADYPTRPVRWVVGYPAGGSTDITARIIGQWLSERLGQQFIVENKPGAGNNIGTETVINAPPDGYTVYLVNPANAINATLYPKLSFNFIRDMLPVAGIMRVPNVMEVTPSLPVKTVAEFITYAQANPGKINWATSGNGTSVHLSGELFKIMTGVQLHACSVPRVGARAHRHDQRASARDVRQHAVVAAAHPGRQAACARRNDGKAFGRAARCADGRRHRGGLTRPAPSSAWVFPRARRPKSSRSSTRRSTRGWPIRRSRRKLAELGGMLISGTPADFGKVVAEETDKWAKVIKTGGVTLE